MSNATTPTSLDDYNDSNEVVILGYRQLSDAQYLLAYPFAAVSCCLSLFGSISLVILILRHKKHRGAQAYDRIILGMASFDIITTICIALQAFILPRDIIDLPLAAGNTTSCSIVGALMLWCSGSFIYNCELSLYFLFSVRYGRREGQVSEMMEPWIHILPLAASVAVTVLCLLLQVINPSPLTGTCELIEFPPKCSRVDELECQRGAPSSATCCGITKLIWPACLSDD